MNAPEIKPVHKIGNVYDFVGLYYILALVHHNRKTVRVSLIGMTNGFPWSEEVTVKDPCGITNEEWIKIVGGTGFVEEFILTPNPISNSGNRELGSNPVKRT
jgi:hypothetical protein